MQTKDGAITIHLRRCCQRRVDLEHLPPRVQRIQLLVEGLQHRFVRADEQLFADLGTR